MVGGSDKIMQVSDDEEASTTEKEDETTIDDDKVVVIDVDDGLVDGIRMIDIMFKSQKKTFKVRLPNSHTVT